MNSALAAAATLVAVAFALSTLDRWLRRRRPHEAAWTVSLALFALGSAALWWAEGDGWSLGAFRVFYLAGAVLNVPWLALGTVYLLAGPQVGNRVRTWLVLLSGFAAGVVLFGPTKTAGERRRTAHRERTSSVWPAGARRRRVGGGGARDHRRRALERAWRVWRGRMPSLGAASDPGPRRLALGNVLIAIGTLVLSASGTLAGRLGKDRAFAITLLAGIAVLFAGFLVASATTRRRHLSPVDEAAA